jgi:hypothetical protein
MSWASILGHTYCSLGSVSTWTKWIMIFFKKIIYKFEIIIFSWSMISSSEEWNYSDCSCYNYDSFQHLNFIFSWKFVFLC